MRTTIIVTALLPAALSSVIPITEASPTLSLDARLDATLLGLGGKILQADIYAGVASLNQKAYHATQQFTQLKTCNPLNIIVRREW